MEFDYLFIQGAQLNPTAFMGRVFGLFNDWECFARRCQFDLKKKCVNKYNSLE